ncbi:hypothetical protein TPB0596_13190 [Tsukamurella pulmonis]|uniref:hypothetical protein n=1 Tax=Tsukamurella pulmonis TaxID=47312 RepID=UPI001EDE1307|nr:hypothetical protein [Tsukamurella pulmonis]BDD81556.1 hypothetical protein TPB0596_13190 [Tsukamurella pulmonis]
MTTTPGPLTTPGAPVPHAATREVDGCSFALRGRIDVTALRAAYAALLEEYPALAARVTAEHDRFRFAPGDPAVAAAIGFRDTAAPWAGFAQTPPSFVGTEQLSALWLTGIGEENRLTLWISRAAAQPVGVLAPARRLFEFYTALAAGDRPRVHRPIGVRAFGFPTEPQRLPAAGGRPAREPEGARTDDALRLRLDARTTADLLDTAQVRAIPLGELVGELLDRAGAPAGRIEDLGTVGAPVAPANLEVPDFHSHRTAAAPQEDSYVLSVFAGRLSVELRARPGTPAAESERLLLRIEDEIRSLLPVGTAA